MTQPIRLLRRPLTRRISLGCASLLVCASALDAQRIASPIPARAELPVSGRVVRVEELPPGVRIRITLRESAKTRYLATLQAAGPDTLHVAYDDYDARLLTARPTALPWGSIARLETRMPPTRKQRVERTAVSFVVAAAGGALVGGILVGGFAEKLPGDHPAWHRSAFKLGATFGAAIGGTIGLGAGIADKSERWRVVGIPPKR